MYNSKYLKVDNPSKKNLKNPSPQVSVPFESQEGFMNGLPPEGHHYRILGDTLFNPTPFPITAVANTGQVEKLLPFHTKPVNFNGADYVDEYLDDDQIAELQKGGYVIKEYDTGGEPEEEDPFTKYIREKEQYKKDLAAWEARKKKTEGSFEWVPDNSDDYNAYLNVVNAVPPVTIDGQTFKLSDYLQRYKNDNGIMTYGIIPSDALMKAAYNKAVDKYGSEAENAWKDTWKKYEEAKNVGDPRNFSNIVVNRLMDDRYGVEEWNDIQKSNPVNNLFYIPSIKKQYGVFDEPAPVEPTEPPPPTLEVIKPERIETLPPPRPIDNSVLQWNPGKKRLFRPDVQGYWTKELMEGAAPEQIAESRAREAKLEEAGRTYDPILKKFTKQLGGGLPKAQGGDEVWGTAGMNSGAAFLGTADRKAEQDLGPTVAKAESIERKKESEKRIEAEKKKKPQYTYDKQGTRSGIKSADLSFEATNKTIAEQKKEEEEALRQAALQAETKYRLAPDAAEAAGITEDVLYDDEGNYDWNAVAKNMATDEYQQKLRENFLQKQQAGYDAAPWYQRAAHNVSAFLSDPILVGSQLMEGRGPLTGQMDWLDDPAKAQKLASRFGLTAEDLYDMSGENDSYVNDLFKFINPGHWGTQAGVGIQDASTALDEGRYLDAAGNIGYAGLNLFDAGALAKAAPTIGRGSARMLNNVSDFAVQNKLYNYNPLAVGHRRLINQPEAFYRQLDEATYAADKARGTVAGMPESMIPNTQGFKIVDPVTGVTNRTNFNLGKNFGDDAYFNKGSLYYNNPGVDRNMLYVSKLPEENWVGKVNNNFTSKDKTSIRVPAERGAMSMDDMSVYELNPFWGYQPVGQGNPVQRFLRNVDSHLTADLPEGAVTSGFSFRNFGRPKSTVASSNKPSSIVQSRPMKVTPDQIGTRLNELRSSGKYWDEQGIPGAQLLHDPSMINFKGSYSGRPIVEVTMPDGSTQFFYKSSGWAGKSGQGIKGTTEGQWQVYGGHSNHPMTSGDNWFIKDSDYKNFYGSDTYREMANALDDALMRKFEVNDPDMLNQLLNFKNINRGNDFTPGFKQGGYVDMELEEDDINFLNFIGVRTEDI